MHERRRISLVARPLYFVAGLALLMVMVAGCGTGSSSTNATSSGNTSSTSAQGASTPSGQHSSSSSASAGQQWSHEPKMTISPSGKYTATLVTNRGTMTMQLLAKSAPHAVNNFIFLAQHHFYDGVPFHRIIKGFVIQTGDPTGTGTGGPGYTIKDDPVTGAYTPGTVAMANTGAPNSGGSQFFICLSNLSAQLTKTYSIFGKITKGMNVAQKIGDTPVTAGPSGESSSPTEKITLEHVIIHGA